MKRLERSTKVPIAERGPGGERSDYSHAFNDAQVQVIIEGGPFRPAYDIDTAAEAIRGAGLPELLADRLYVGQ